MSVFLDSILECLPVVRLLSFCSALFVSLCFGSLSWGGPYDAPASYYSGATGTGSTLKSQLSSAMSAGHIQRSYGDFRNSAKIHDADPNNPGNILLVYNRESVSGNWDQGNTWNREHVWPVSRQPGTRSDNSSRGNLGDHHALRPANTSINNSRGNKPFGFENTTGTFGSVGSYYFPGDVDKGDIARQVFYSDTRWGPSLGLSIVDSFPSGNQMGDLSSMIAWHYLDTPDEFEQRRNHAIYSSTLNPLYYTNNRSAYVDHPEFVWSVYVDQNNDSQLYVGSSPSSNGTSDLDVDLGSVIVGGATPSPQNVTLHKNGFDGTYYEVSTTGNATSSIEGRYNAFPILNSGGSGSDSTSLMVGLNGSSATVGEVSGSVLINNLDVTTGEGTGFGDNDGDDTINVSYDVLDHSEASFSSLLNQDTFELDFGTVALGSPVPSLSFDIFNLEDTAGFTASLELDSIFAAGDSGFFSTDLTTFTGVDALEAGESNSYSVSFDTSTLGSYSLGVLLSFSDEDLSGAAAGDSMLINFVGEVIAASIPGDYNNDGMVSQDDLNLVLLNWGGTTTPSGWINQPLADGQISQNELNEVILNWGNQVVAATATTVPEPASLVILLASAGSFLIRTRRSLQR